MGWISDLLRAAPADPLRGEKLTAAEKKVAELEAENAALKDDLRKGREEVQRLKERIERMPGGFETDEAKRAIIRALAGSAAPVGRGQLMDRLNVGSNVMEYHLAELVRRGYIEPDQSSRATTPKYHLTQRGREFAVENGLG